MNFKEEDYMFQLTCRHLEALA